VWKNILLGVISAVVAGVILSLIFLPSGLREDIQEIDKRLSRLEGKFETFETLQKDFSQLFQQVSDVQHEIEAVTASVEVDQTEFTFLAPQNGDTVDRFFRVEGTLSRQVSLGQLWLVVEIGGLAWPKEPEVKVIGNRWFGEVNEQGQPPKGEFRLSLWHIDEAGKKEIQKLLADGRETGKFPGLKGVPGGRRLKSINLILRP
jgi:hypothetical protein